MGVISGILGEGVVDAAAAIARSALAHTLPAAMIRRRCRERRIRRRFGALISYCRELLLLISADISARKRRQGPLHAKAGHAISPRTSYRPHFCFRHDFHARQFIGVLRPHKSDMAAMAVTHDARQISSSYINNDGTLVDATPLMVYWSRQEAKKRSCTSLRYF